LISEGILAIPQTWQFDLDAGQLVDPVTNNAQPEIWFNAVTDTERYLSPVGQAKLALTDITSSSYQDCVDTLTRPSDVQSLPSSSPDKVVPLGSIPLDVNRDIAINTEARFCVRTSVGAISLFWLDSPLDTYPRTMLIRYKTWSGSEVISSQP
jgi:hypothetical protein